MVGGVCLPQRRRFVADEAAALHSEWLILHYFSSDSINYPRDKFFLQKMAYYTVISVYNRLS